MEISPLVGIRPSKIMEKVLDVRKYDLPNAGYRLPEYHAIVESYLRKWKTILFVARVIKKIPKVTFVLGYIDDNTLFMETI